MPLRLNLKPGDLLSNTSKEGTYIYLILDKSIREKRYLCDCEKYTTYKVFATNYGDTYEILSGFEIYKTDKLLASSKNKNE